MSDRTFVPMLRLDLRSLFATSKSWLLFLGVVLIVPLFAGAEMAVAMAAAGGLLTSMTLFALDETHRLKQLYGGLPVQRRTVIVSHYIVGALLILGFIGFGLLVGLGASVVRQQPLGDMGLAAAGTVGALFLVAAFTLPLYVRFGGRTAPVVVLSGMMLIIGGGILLRDVAKWQPIVPQIAEALSGAGAWLVVALPLVGLASLAASCLVSIAIYRRQDH